MTNFFQSAQIPQTLKPEPAGFSDLRNLLEGNATNLMANPYGLGSTPLPQNLLPSQGRGTFNPYTGQYQQSPTAGMNPQAGMASTMGGQGGGSGAGGSGLMSLIQALQGMQGQGGGGAPQQGALPRMAVPGQSYTIPDRSRQPSMDGVRYDAFGPNIATSGPGAGPFSSWSSPGAEASVGGPGMMNAPSSTASSAPPPSNSSVAPPPAPRVTSNPTSTTPQITTQPVNPAPTTPTPTPTQNPNYSPTGGFGGPGMPTLVPSSPTNTSGPAKGGYHGSQGGNFWEGFDGEPQPTPTPVTPIPPQQAGMAGGGIQGLLAMLASLMGLGGPQQPTAFAQAGTKGADVGEQQKRADQIINNNGPSPTPTPGYDGSLATLPKPGGKIPNRHFGNSSLRPYGGNDLGNGSLRSYDGAYGGIQMPRPVRTPMQHVSMPSVRPPKSPQAALGKILSGLSGANRFGQSTAFRTQMGHQPVYDADPNAPLTPRMDVQNNVSAPTVAETQGGATSQPPGNGWSGWGGPTWTSGAQATAPPPLQNQASPGPPQQQGGGGSLPGANVPASQAGSSSSMYPWLMPYQGNLTAGMSGAQNQALNSMQQSNQGNYGLGGAQSYLNSELSGSNMGQANPYMNQIMQGLQQQQSIQDPRALAQIQSSMAAGGNALSGADAIAQGQYLNQSNAAMNQEQGNLGLQNLMQQQQLQSNAATQSGQLANTIGGLQGQLMNAGAVPQQTQQNADTAAYNDYLRQVGGMQQQSNLGNQLALQTLQTSPGSYQPMYQGSSQASQLMSMLGSLGLTSGIGSALGGLLGTNSSGGGGGGLLGALGNLFGGGSDTSGTTPTGGSNDPNNPEFWGSPDSNSADTQNFMDQLMVQDPQLYQYFQGGGT